METPNILVGTSRGVVPHLSRDHCNSSDAIKWINVPFESFLERVPPIPTMQTGPNPLHRFFGFDSRRHIASFMPPNGNAYVSANCIRGVRKVTLSDWRNYVYKMQPDIVFALTDTPFTSPPHSQKRVTKSIERSAAWVGDILRPIPDAPSSSEPQSSRVPQHPLNVFIHMAGGTSLRAREAFAHGLREKRYGPEAEAIKPLQFLDDGISGYSFDLATLRGIKPHPNTSYHQSLPDGFLRLEKAPTPTTTSDPSPTPSPASSLAEPLVPPTIASLLKASLAELPEGKPRLVTGVRSPHEMLRLIRDVGVDIFDTGWAINAANVGAALDFVFPALPIEALEKKSSNLGHNLYDVVYAHQFGRLADSFADPDAGVLHRRVCPCFACSPQSPSSHILHSTLDDQSYADTAHGEVVVEYDKPCSRAYLHHLLHTHEMSAHTLLVAHNLEVVSALLTGVREMLADTGGEGRVRFALEVERFESAYDESMEVFSAARKDWKEVDTARGKGRLTREKAKEVANGEID
ncbi:tRNA-guanine(15) transglycosylase-like protein [Melanogaster broomeanus]|nr:tRNA-guanine(15) transglycosylase-like protein [Melanogaster broomeanus]